MHKNISEAFHGLCAARDWRFGSFHSGGLHTLEVFEERLGPLRGIVLLYTRQQRAMAIAPLRQGHL